MKFHSVRFIAVFISYFQILSFTYAINNSVSGFYGIYGSSDTQEIYGQYINAESYTRLGTSEDYDPGYLEDFWGWHLRSETGVTNSYGTVTASSQTPAPVGAWMETGSASFELGESAEALAWMNTQSVYSPDTDETVNIEFYYSSGFNLPAGLDASVTFYFGIWENEIATDNLMLNEKDGWTLSQLDFNGQTYLLLQQSFTSF